MIGTITPVVHGGSRLRWMASALSHLGGGVVGGALAGAALGSMGSMAGGWIWALPAGLALLYGLHQSGLAQVPRLERRRQVPANWRLRLPRVPMALAYGLVLGTGLLTYIPVASFYALAGVALAWGDPFRGAVLLGLYGGARTILVLLVGWRIVDVEGLDRASERLETWGDPLRAANAAGSMMLAGYLVGLLASNALPG